MPANIDIIINGKDMTGDAVSSAKSGLAGLSNSVDAVGGKFNAMTVAVGTVVGNLATSAISKLGEMASSIVTTGIGFDSMKQQADIAFTTMLGSGEKAKAFLDKLQAFAAKTPFEFPDLVMASQRMLAMGIQSDKVLPTLTAIGDAVAGLGGSSAMVDRVTTALGQMQAKGKATGEEMMQLTEAGIPAWDFLAKKIGVSIPEAMKMVTAGAVSADVAISALTEGMNTKFGGMMEKQSATFAGLWSTIKDTFGQISGQVMQPLFEQMGAGLKMIVDWTNTPEFTAGVKLLTGWMEKLGQILGDTFSNMETYHIPILTAFYIAIGRMVPPELLPVVEGLRDVLTAVTRTVQNLFVEVKRYEDDEPMIGYLLDLSDKAREGFKVIFDWSVKVVGKLWDWAERVMPPLVEGLAKFFDQLGLIVEAVQKVFGPVGSAITKFVKFDDVMTALGILLAGPVIAAIGSVIGALATFLAPIAAVVAAVAALRWAWEQDLGGIRTFTLSSVQKISDWFFTESGIWKGTWEDTWVYIAERVRHFFKYDIYNAIVGTWAEIKFEWTFNTTIIRDKTIAWTNEIIQNLTNWKDRAIGAITGFVTWIVDTWKDWTGPTIKDIKDWVDVTKSHIDTWTIYYVNEFTKWKDDMLELFQPVFDWWKDHVQPWIDFGRDIIQGLWDGMKETWKRFTNWTSTTFQGWVDWFDRLFEFGSPSKVMQQRGEWLMEGLGNGIEAYANVPLTMLESTVNSMTAQLDRLKGAVVQNVFDINNAVAQLNLNPLTMPEWLGGTGKVVGLGPNGELIMEGIDKLPTATTPQLSTSPASTNSATNNIGSAVGGNIGTVGTSQGLLGGINLSTGDIGGLKQSAADAATKVKDFIAGLSDYIGETVDSRTVSRAFWGLDSNLTGQPELQAAEERIRGEMADLLGVNTLYGRLSDSLGAVIDKVTSGTDINKVADLLQSAVNFRGLANYYSTSDYADVLPTDTRLTGGKQTTNTFNITLAGSSNATADVMGMVQLLSSLTGTASP